MKNKIRSVIQIGANYGNDDLSWYLKKNKNLDIMNLMQLQ